MADGKACAKCGVWKPYEGFHRSNQGKYLDGRLARCKQCRSEDAAERYKRDRDKILASNRRWMSENKEAHKVASRKWYEKNYERHKANCAQWAQKNPQKVQVHVRARRAAKLGASGSATYEQIMARVAYFGWKCWMCGQPWQEIDHVKPLARGGSNWPSNLRPACKSCNSSKRHKWPYLSPKSILIRG